MNNRHYYEAHTSYYMSGRQRRRAMRRKIRRTCNILIAVSLFFMFGVMGSAELGEISMVEFMIHEAISAVVLLASTAIRVNV